MRYEFTHNLKIPKIGFGCWNIGGQDSADPSQEAASLAALRSALQLGYTHFDTAEYYAGGHSEELLGQAVRESGLPRESFFITSKVSPEHLAYQDVLHSCENSLRRTGLDYLDLYLIHWPMAGMRLSDAFRALNQLVHEGRVKNLGVSNFNLKLLREACAISDSPLLTNQVPYSLPDHTYLDNGVLAHCQANDILLTAYSPVKSSFFKGPKLRALADVRGLTPQQLGLAWLVRQPGVIAIPTSFNPRHQAENLLAADLTLSEDELRQMDQPAA